MTDCNLFLFFIMLTVRKFFDKTPAVPIPCNADQKDVLQGNMKECILRADSNIIEDT